MSKTKVYEELTAIFEHSRTTEDILMIGLSSEVGEVQAEWLKENRPDRMYTDRTEQVLDELADVLWYVTRLAAWRGSDLHALMQRNLIKLEQRSINGKD